MVIRRPNVRSQVWTSFTQEFQKDVWVVVVFFLMGSIAFIYFTTRMSPLEVKRFTLSDVVLMTFGSFCGQGRKLNVSFM